MENPDLFGLDSARIWDIKHAYQHLNQIGRAGSKRTAERLLHALAMLPAELNADDLADEFGAKPTPAVLHWEIETARSERKLVLFVQLAHLPGGQDCLHANDGRGARYWVPLAGIAASPDRLASALQNLQHHIGKDLTVFPHDRLVGIVRQTQACHQVGVSLLSYPSVLDLHLKTQARPATGTPYLKHLEAESIHILREAIAEATNPVMLYSLGKDSSVMLHLARKAFYPAPPPFPLLHVDTRWKFQDMYRFRDLMARESGMDLLIHINPEAIAKNINPFDHGSALHTNLTKTEGLKQALDKHKFDVVLGGARRDEEKSRAKERIFSFRTQTHHWDPKNQRPELWNLYNTHINPGESIRVFPLSNWTELDIWQYIYQEGIPVVPLYFAKQRPSVFRDGKLLMIDDARMRLRPDETILRKKIRFRTLGCYPLTGAIESDASSVAEIILELIGTRNSERQGRSIDTDTSASMEKRKREGYF